MSLEILILSFAAFVAGFVDAVAGGGGVVTFPAFIFLGLPISEVVGTVKLVSIAGTSVAAHTFIRRGHVQRELVSVALPFTFIGSLLGAVVVMALPNEFLKPLVSVLIIGVALYCYVRPELGIEHSYGGLSKRLRYLTQAAAFGLGFYDGFFGPGTGIFLAFFFIRTVQCDFLRATANTKVLNWASNLAALAYFLIGGSIRFDLGVPMLIANIAGGYLGAHTAIARGSAFIKWIYLLMAALTSLKLLADWFV